MKEAQQSVCCECSGSILYEFWGVSAILGGVTSAQSDSLSYLRPVTDTEYSCVPP